MSPAHLQAQQVAAQVAARLGQGGQQQPNSEAMQKARDLINKMVNPTNGGGHPQGGSLGGGGQGGGGGGFNGGNGGGGGGSGGGGGGGPGRPGLGSSNYTEVMIPGSKVGLIIGKGGETIKQLQEKTGAKMVIIQDGPGQEMEKPLRISGDPQKVEHAKQLVYDLIQDKGEAGGQPSGGRSNYNNNRDSMGGGGGGGGGHTGGGDQQEIFVPKAAVGVVIGKGGDMIKKIQNETGCRLQFLQTKGDGPGDRRCIVQGTKDQVEDGKRMIEDLIESVLRRNGEGGGGGGGRGGNGDMYGNGGGGGGGGGYGQSQQAPAAGGVQVQQEQYQFVVPASKCGIIIGRGGDTIKQINQQSGAHCEMDRKVSSNQTVEKTFTIKGEQHQVDEAKRLITDKINMDLNLVHMGTATVTQQQNGYGQQSTNRYEPSWGAGNISGYGSGAGGWNEGQAGGPMGPQMGAAAAGAGQPDYSAQWIEYYR